jgi:hypothetical protein
MAELVRTNNPALLNLIEALLTEFEIPYQVADRNMSVLEGSINLFLKRVLVHDEQEDEARELLTEADLGQWLKPKSG